MKKITLLSFLIILICSNVTVAQTKAEWSQIFSHIPPLPQNISDWSQAKVHAIHRYLCIERWNQKRDIGVGWGTPYANMAEALSIHVKKLEAADKYVHYTLFDPLEKKIKNLLKNNSKIKPDHYHPIRQTAYCGTYTLHASIILDGCKSDKNLRKRARIIAQEFKESLPEKIDGFKITDSRYECEKTGTTGSIGIAFLWKRGKKIREMKPSHGLYGKSTPERCYHWHQHEWNDGNTLKQIKINAND